MYLMYKVGRLTDAHQRGSRVQVLHPRIDLLVCAERKVVELVLALDFQAEWLEIDALDILDLLEVDQMLRRGCLLIISPFPMIHSLHS